MHVAHDSLQDIGRRLGSTRRVTNAEEILFHGLILMAGAMPAFMP
jgi:hypothetical protein